MNIRISPVRLQRVLPVGTRPKKLVKLLENGFVKSRNGPWLAKGPNANLIRRVGRVAFGPQTRKNPDPDAISAVVIPIVFRRTRMPMVDARNTILC